MAYYNGFQAAFQPLYQSPYNQPYQQPQTAISPVQTPQTPAQMQGGLIWVQGEAGAKSYLVAPNNTVQLWDSESQTIYLKSADASGMPSMKILDYTIRETAKNTANSASVVMPDNLPDYATKDEIKVVSEQITALRERVDSLTRKRRREDIEE